MRQMRTANQCCMSTCMEASTCAWRSATERRKSRPKLLRMQSTSSVYRGCGTPRNQSRWRSGRDRCTACPPDSTRHTCWGVLARRPTAVTSSVSDRRRQKPVRSHRRTRNLITPNSLGQQTDSCDPLWIILIIRESILDCTLQLYFLLYICCRILHENRRGNSRRSMTVPCRHLMIKAHRLNIYRKFGGRSTKIRMCNAFSWNTSDPTSSLVTVSFSVINRLSW